MRATRLRFIAILASATPVLTFAAADHASAQDVDVTGTWMFDVETAQGGGTPTVTLEQDGETLTGHYSSDNLGEADLTGSVEGSQVTFSFDVDVQGTALTVTYTGTVEGPDAMSGTVDLGGMADGTFTATRQT